MEKDNRKKLLEALISGVEKPENITPFLNRYNWDYEGTPIFLSKKNIKNALLRFIDFEWNAEGIEQWADALEVREDVEYIHDEADEVSEIVHILARLRLGLFYCD